MELVKSKGMVIFLVMIISLTIIGALNSEKQDSVKLKNTYVSYNQK